jgi:hypothetical protein
MYRVLTPQTSNHCLMTLAMNSEPLSERMKSGSPLRRNSDERVSTTSSAVIERPTSMLRHSLVYSSTTGIIFSLLPSSVRSITKSEPQTWSMYSARLLVQLFSLSPGRRRRLLSPPLVLLAFGHFETFLWPQPIHPLLVELNLPASAVPTRL